MNTRQATAPDGAVSIAGASCATVSLMPRRVLTLILGVPLAFVVTLALATRPAGAVQVISYGGISGTVTDAFGGFPLERIDVCALGAEESVERCEPTDANGEYTLTGLASGSYKVEFSPAEQCGSPCPVQRDFLTQFYNDKASFAEAEPVPVTAGETTSGIDARLIEGGKISGVVTSAADGSSIEGIDVCALPVGDGDYGGCESTNASGEYTISGLPNGSYDVMFFASEVCKSTCPHQNYITQYYSGKPTRGDAEPVPVTTGNTTSAIDAQMVIGGQITGRVTNASSGDPIEGIEACALRGSEEPVRACAATNANGEYTILALASGSYQVEFSSGGGYNCEPNCAQNYVTQFYDGRPPAEAEPVQVTTGNTTSGIDAQMVEGDRIIVGEEAGPPGGPLTPGGSGGQGTSGVNPSPPPLITLPGPGSGGFSLGGPAVAIQGDRQAAVTLRCTGTSACAGRLMLTAKVAGRRGGKKRGKTQTIGSASFIVPAGRTTLFKVKLNKAGWALIRASHGHLGAIITVFNASPGSSNVWTENVELAQGKTKTRK